MSLNFASFSWTQICKLFFPSLLVGLVIMTLKIWSHFVKESMCLVCVYLWLCFALFKLITELLGIFNLFPFSTAFFLHLLQLIRTWNHQSSHSAIIFWFIILILKIEGYCFCLCFFFFFSFSACNAFLRIGFWKEQINLNFLLHLSGGDKY